ncbi:MAG: hypothetical protein ACO1RT_08645 [Planctomycetaceae bacterium]
MIRYIACFLVSGLVIGVQHESCVAQQPDVSVEGTWTRKDDRYAPSQYVFKADGSGSNSTKTTDPNKPLVWTFMWTQSRNKITLKQREDLKLTIEARLVEQDGKTLLLVGDSGSAGSYFTKLAVIK